jgi:hypothetical protein
MLAGLGRHPLQWLGWLSSWSVAHAHPVLWRPGEV